MEIRRIHLIEYYLAFSGFHTALSNRYAAQAEKDGWIYSALVGNRYAGFMIVMDELDKDRIAYAFTVPEMRRHGVFTVLMQHVLQHHGKEVWVNVSLESPCYEIVRGRCLQMGFLPGERVTVFSCYRKEEGRWRAFMDKRGSRLCNMLEMHGYRAVSFRDLDEDLTEQLRLSDQSGYGNIFHPSQYLDNPAKKLDPDLSFAAVKDGKLDAYCLVVKGNESSVVFDQISVSAEELGHGVILLPYVYSMERFFEHGYSYAKYAMYQSNKHANAFRTKVLGIFSTKETVRENYIHLK